jgi:transposase
MGTLGPWFLTIKQVIVFYHASILQVPSRMGKLNIEQQLCCNWLYWFNIKKCCRGKADVVRVPVQPETILAKKYNAAVVREDLSILAKGKATQGYRGRTFNKMITNGSKGQYIKRASDKLRWDGIPELVIPSYHTSSACTVHSLVEATMRQGEEFFCPQCGVRQHADLHAADTIGNYLLLRPVPAQQVTLQLPRGRQSAGNLLVGSPNQ